MVWTTVFGEARGEMVLSAKPHGNVRRVSVAADHLVRVFHGPGLLDSPASAGELRVSCYLNDKVGQIRAIQIKY